jgi:hypothetical protein
MSQAKEHRSMVLHEQAAAAALDSDDDKEATLKRLMSSQERCETHQRLDHVFKSANTGAISHLEVPTGEWQWPHDPKQVSSWTKECDSQKVEDHLFDRHIHHFGQAKETPFTKAPFSDMPFDDTGPTVDAVLDCAFECEQHGPHGEHNQLFIDALKRKLPTLPADIAEKDISNGFRVWREMTSTSPSNRHLGHCKALLSSDGHTDKDTTKHLAEEFMEVHFQMTALCAKLGMSLNRWQEVVTATLEKDTGSPKLHRLRATHLLEADLNLLIKIIIARRFVWHGEKTVSLAKPKPAADLVAQPTTLSSKKN